MNEQPAEFAFSIFLSGQLSYGQSISSAIPPKSVQVGINLEQIAEFSLSKESRSPLQLEPTWDNLPKESAARVFLTLARVLSWNGEAVAADGQTA